MFGCFQHPVTSIPSLRDDLVQKLSPIFRVDVSELPDYTALQSSIQYPSQSSMGVSQIQHIIRIYWTYMWCTVWLHSSKSTPPKKWAASARTLATCTIMVHTDLGILLLRMAPPIRSQNVRWFLTVGSCRWFKSRKVSGKLVIIEYTQLKMF